jgi:hypothetical protein
MKAMRCVPMTLSHGKNGSTWYSHTTAAGWCKGSVHAEAPGVSTHVPLGDISVYR